MSKLANLKFDKLQLYLDQLFFVDQNKVYYYLPPSYDLLCQKLNLDIKKNIKIIEKFISKRNFDHHQKLDEEVMQNFLLEKGYEFEKVPYSNFYERLQYFGFEILKPKKNIDKNLVITVMGHVDHGKTSLLDVIRNSNVANLEDGKITQKIGGYQIFFDNHRLTFIDTPGHNLFSKMRRQGIDVTDLVVLVVSGVEGVKKQTIEAIEYAQKANAPILIFINKNDLPQSNPELVMQRLSSYNLIPKEWGGETIFVNGSCRTKKGISELLKEIVNFAKTKDLQVNLNALPKAVVVDSYVDRQGVKTSIILQKGILKLKDPIFVGRANGKVKALINDLEKPLQNATPGMCILLLGLNKVVKTGDLLFSFPDEKLVSNLSKNYVENDQKISIDKEELQKQYLENFWNSNKKENQINVLIKFNYKGVEEVFQNCVSDLKSLNKNERYKLNFIDIGIGDLTLNDLNLAILNKAYIITFGLKIGKQMIKKIKENKLLFFNFTVLHKLFEFLQDLKKFKKIEEKIILGKAKVLRIFNHSKFGTIAGCVVLQGKIVLNNKYKFEVLRDQKILALNLNAKSLKHEKDDIVSAFPNQEFGIVLDKFKLFQENDLVCQYQIKEINETKK